MDQTTSTILMLVVLFALMYFLMIRPRRTSGRSRHRKCGTA